MYRENTNLLVSRYIKLFLTWVTEEKTASQRAWRYFCRRLRGFWYCRKRKRRLRLVRDDQIWIQLKSCSLHEGAAKNYKHCPSNVADLCWSFKSSQNLALIFLPLFTWRGYSSMFKTHLFFLKKIVYLSDVYHIPYNTKIKHCSLHPPYNFCSLKFGF